MTFLFSDVEDSTGILHRLGPGYRDVIEQHANLVRAALDDHEGLEVSTEGDSFFAVFTNAPAAIGAAIAIQRAMDEADWPQGGTVRLRIGVHTGHGELGGDNYLGLDVNRAARIEAAGHGGQVVVSETAKALAANAEYLDLGVHRLKGLEKAEHLFQLLIPGLPESFPPLRSLDSRPNNLPAFASQLIGREEDARRLHELLDKHRLVTITGPGGTGKTRLAIGVAADALAEYHDGAFFIDLAPIDDPALVPSAVGAVLGVAQADLDGLVKALADRSQLLVLDNLEQVIGAASDIGRLVGAAANVRFLATSQLPLRLSGEAVFRLDPLPVGNGTGELSPAGKLFVDRATQADPEFRLEEHADDITALVAALEGLPLALELAAARVNVLTPGEILERLGKRGAGVLKTAAADAPERHRSLTDAIEWSVGLLSPSQRRTLLALAVFRGGATLRALETVLDDDPLDDLSELVDRSLVRPLVGKAGKRFGLLAAVHLYAEEKLASLAEADELIERHLEHFYRLACAAAPHLESDQVGKWLAILGDDHENLQAGLDRLHQAGDAERGFDLLGHSWRYFQGVGRFNELELWLERFFALPDAERPGPARVRALMARGAIAYWRRLPDDAVVDYEAAVALAREFDDRTLLADALYGLATSNAIGGYIEAAKPPLEESEALYQELNDTRGLAAVAAGSSFLYASTAYEALPDEDRLRHAVELYEQAGMRLFAAHGMLGLAGIALVKGDAAAAKEIAEQAILRAEEAGDSFVMAWAVEWAALAMIEMGDAETGAIVAGAAAAARERIGGGWTPANYGLDDAATRARDVLDEQRAEELLATGRDETLYAAVKLVRGE